MRLQETEYFDIIIIEKCKGEELMSSVSLSKYYKSFSGTDTIAFLLFPGLSPITIGSLTTVSYSMYRVKQPVINIGRTNINGVTRGTRIYAGSMIFTLINKHWVRELQDKAPYLKDIPTLKTDELPLCDVMLVSANEYGSAVTMLIYGLEFTDEGQVISVEDLYTENTIKFIARDISLFDEFIVTTGGKTSFASTILNTSLTNNMFLENINALSNIKETYLNVIPLNRVLFYIRDKNPLLKGEDVTHVQTLLNKYLIKPINITNEYDYQTERAVKEFQSSNGLEVNGIVDNNTYTKLLEKTRENNSSEYMQVINTNGALVYEKPDESSTVVQILPYLSNIEVFGKVIDNLVTFYKTRNGYVALYDIYDYKNNNNTKTFQIINKKNYTSQQISIIHDILTKLYNAVFTSNNYDDKIEGYIKHFQANNGLVQTGQVDYLTWQALLGADKDNKNKNTYESNSSTISYTKDPGDYEIVIENLDDYKVTISSNDDQQVKFTIISKYANGKTSTDSKTITNKNNNTYSLEDFNNMFNDSPKNGTPTDVYYYIYPYGYTCSKWHFKVK